MEPSRAGGERVVVMQITNGSPGAHYTCRFRFEDGSVRDAGDWVTPRSGQATWIGTVSSGAVERVDLVTDDGKVWSTATLP